MISSAAFWCRSSFNRRCSFHTQRLSSRPYFPFSTSRWHIFLLLPPQLFFAAPPRPLSTFLGAHWISLCAQIVLVFKLKARDCFYACGRPSCSLAPCAATVPSVFCFPFFLFFFLLLQVLPASVLVCVRCFRPRRCSLPSSVSCCLRNATSWTFPAGLSGPRLRSAFNVVLRRSLALSGKDFSAFALSVIRLLLGTCLTRNYFGPVALFPSPLREYGWLAGLVCIQTKST